MREGERKPRDLRWPITGIVGAICLVLVVLAAFLDEPWTVRLGQAADMAQLLGLVAVALAVPQPWALVEEQRRTNEALRPPAFAIGFDVGAGRTTEGLAEEVVITPEWIGMDDISVPVPLAVVVRNVGARPAEECYVSYRWPERVDIRPSGLEVHEDGGDRFATVGDLTIHPAMMLLCSMTVRLRRGYPPRSRIELHVSIAMRNVERVERMLHIVLAPPAQ